MPFTTGSGALELNVPRSDVWSLPPRLSAPTPTQLPGHSEFILNKSSGLPRPKSFPPSSALGSTPTKVLSAGGAEEGAEKASDGLTLLPQDGWDPGPGHLGAPAGSTDHHFNPITTRHRSPSHHNCLPSRPPSPAAGQRGLCLLSPSSKCCKKRREPRNSLLKGQTNPNLIQLTLVSQEKGAECSSCQVMS